MRTLTIELTDQAHAMLQELERRGLYGSSPQEAAVRLIDQGLIEMSETPLLKLAQSKGGQ